MAPKSRRFRAKIRKPRKRIPYVAPKPNKPRLWVKAGKDVLVLKYRPNLQETKISYFSNNKLKTPTACVIAPLLSKIAQPQHWTSLHLQQILELADEVYRATINALKLKTNSKYPLQCINPQIFLNNYRLTIVVNSNYPTENMENLKDAKTETQTDVQKILRENDGLVVQCGEKVVALWSEQSNFYCYSPDGCENYQGLPSLTKCKDMKTLLEYMLQYTFGFYSLFAVRILEKTKIHHSLTDILKDCQRMGAGKEPETEPAKEEPVAEEVPAKEKKPKKDAKKAEKEKAAAPSLIKTDYVENLETLPFSKDYKRVEETRGILVGSSYVKDPDRLLHTNIAAAAFLHHIPSYIWTSETIADILRLGKKIFEDSEDVVESEEWTERVALPISFGKKLYDLQYEKVVFGEMTTMDPSVLTFEQGLKKFFEYHDMGLVEGPQNVLIWQERGLFLLFDPKERDGKGRKWTKEYSKALGETKPSGSACVSWFVSPSQMAEAYILNTPFKHRYDPYRLVKLLIIEMKTKYQNWNEWLSVGFDKWILRGTKNLCSLVTAEDQDLPSKALTAAIAALVKSVAKLEEEWDSPDVDGLYQYGMELYKLIQDARGDEPPEATLKLKDVKQRFTIDQNQVDLRREECVLFGPIKADTRSSGEKGKKKLTAGPKLYNGMKLFFDRYKTGILSIRNVSFAMWKSHGHFYIFYPYEKSATKSDCICNNNLPFGMGYVMRFKSLSDFYNELMNITSFNETEQYCINNLLIQIFPASARPPLYNYTEFGETGAILRPYKDLHEGDEAAFDFRADKQTLPNLVTALCFGKINHPAKWSKTDVVDILKIGDRMFCQLATGQAECKFADYEAELDHIQPVIGMNKFRFTKETIEGRMIIPPPEGGEENEGEGGFSEMDGVEEEDDLYNEPAERANDLHGVLTNWNEANPAKTDAILEASAFKVAIWKRDDLYYVFDPKASGEHGEVTEKRLEVLKDKAGPAYNAIGMLTDYSAINNDGTAYVAWFTHIEELVEHLKNKVPEEHRYGVFRFHDMQITNEQLTVADMDYPPKVGFRAISHNQAIIRGSISQNDFMFANRNKQDASNCAVALGFALISSPSKWSQTLIDIILKYGDRLHSKTVQTIKESSTPERLCVEKIPLIDIINIFRIYKIKFEFNITTKSTGLISVGDLKKHIGKIGNVETGVGAVISMKTHLNAIWKSEGYFYLFDPYETNPMGYLADSGFACLCRFKKLDVLLEFLVDKFSCLAGQNYYEIAVVDLKHYLPPSLSPSPPPFDDFEKLKFVGLLPKNQEMFVDFGDGMRILKNVLPDNRIPENVACLAALVHSRLHYVELWNFNIFERVYFLARYLFNKTECETQTFHKTKHIQFEEISPNFSIDNNMLCHLEISQVMLGAVVVKQKSDGISVSLLNALKLFFRECKLAVLQVNAKFFALWTEGEKFYLFRIEADLNEAHVVSGTTIEAMYHLMVKDSDELMNFYEMWNVKVLLVPVKDAICNPLKTHESNAEEIMHARLEPDSEFSKPAQYNDYLGKHLEKKKHRAKSQFIAMENNVEILTSDYAMDRHPFCSRNDFLPSLKAACVVAAGMATISSPSLWTRRTLTDIVESGINLYVTSLAIHKVKNFEIINLERVFFLQNIRVEVTAFAPAIQTANKQNLLTVLTFILRKHKIAYLMNDAFCFTIILEENACYLYFPGSSQSVCEDFCSTKSCLVKFCALSDLIDRIMEKIIQTQTVLIGPITVFVH